MIKYYLSDGVKPVSYTHLKRNRQQSFQYFLCIRMQCQHHSPSPQRNYQLRFVHTGRFQHSALAVRTVLCQANDYTYRRRYYDTLLCGIYDGTDLQYVIRQTTLKKQKASGNYVRKPFIFRSKKKNLFHLSYSQNIHAILSISGNPPVRISISAMDSITRIISEPVRSVRYP